MCFESHGKNYANQVFPNMLQACKTINFHWKKMDQAYNQHLDGQGRKTDLGLRLAWATK